MIPKVVLTGRHRLALKHGGGQLAWIQMLALCQELHRLSLAPAPVSEVTGDTCLYIPETLRAVKGGEIVSSCSPVGCCPRSRPQDALPHHQERMARAHSLGLHFPSLTVWAHTEVL